MRRRNKQAMISCTLALVLFTAAGCGTETITTSGTDNINSSEEETSEEEILLEIQVGDINSAPESGTEDSPSEEEAVGTSANATGTSGSSSGRSSGTSNSENTPVLSSGSGNVSSSGTVASGAAAASSGAAESTECDHEWESVYVEVLQWEASETQEPIEEKHYRCTHCDYDYTAHNEVPWEVSHICPDGRANADYSNMLTIVGYETVYNPAFYTEVLDHYECSKCGAKTTDGSTIYY